MGQSEIKSPKINFRGLIVEDDFTGIENFTGVKVPENVFRFYKNNNTHDFYLTNR